MRSSFIYVMAIGLLFSACKGKDKDSTTTVTTDNGKITLTVDPTKTETVANEMEKKTEELKKLAPMTLDQIKAMLPAELLGMKRSSFNANAMMGFASADAEYKKDDTSNLKLTVMDCAGEAGSAFYALNYWTKMTMESENDQGYTKTVDFMGGKAVEDYKKYNNSYTLTFTANDRLLITLHGENLSLDVLKDAAKALNLKAT
jgi:hypothetical protein